MKPAPPVTIAHLFDKGLLLTRVRQAGHVSDRYLDSSAEAPNPGVESCSKLPLSLASCGSYERDPWQT